MKKTFIILFKIIITAIVIFFLGDRILQEWDKLGEALAAYLLAPWILVVVIFLMPLNWLIEALKWKISVRAITVINIKQALRGVLTGISLGFVTPHAVGDYFARIWSINHLERKKAIGPILVSRVAQLIPTVLFGSISLFLIAERVSFSNWFSLENSPAYIVIVGSIILVVLVIMFTRYGKHLHQLKSYFNILKKVTKSDYVKLILLSFLRYAVFSLQFIILLSLFNIEISLADQFLGVAFIFLIKSVLPTFNFLNDLGIREFSAVIYFDIFKVDSGPIILASLLLWLINIALPAIVGAFFIRKFKIDLR